MTKIHYLSIPKMGESVSEATIIQWLKKEGDMVKKDEPFVEVSTDKVDSEIPSPFECKILKIHFQKDAVVAVNQAIAEVEVYGEVLLENASKTAVLPTSSPVLQKSVSKPNLSIANTHNLSPLVKKILIENDITEQEIGHIIATGLEGRITKQDAWLYIKNRTHFNEKRAFESVEIPQNITETKLENLPEMDEGDEYVPFDRMRALIAKHMVQSKQISAHCTSFSEIDVTDLVALRDKTKDQFFDEHKLKLTYTHLFMKCTIEALKAFPKLNAHNTTKGYILKKNINLGFATALPDGNLIVPCIKNTEEMSIVQIVDGVNKIASLAKNSNLKPEDIQGGTFTVSNTGIFGSLMGTPIINQPQVAIMSLGEILKTPAVIELEGEDKIVVRKKMIASLSYDHRIIDGAYAASFLKLLKEKIEKFEVLF